MPSTIQHTVDTVLLTVKPHFVPVYLDDFVIFYRSVEKNLDHIRVVLGLPLRADIALGMNKSVSFEVCIDYQGHTIQSGWIAISTKVVDGIYGLQQPTNVIQLKSFFSPFNLFSQFVQNVTHVVFSLSCKLKNNKPFHSARLNETKVESMRTPQHFLLSYSILSLPTSDWLQSLNTAAWNKQIGDFIVLEQSEWAANRTRYWSLSLEKAKHAYDTTHRTFLVVIWAALSLIPYFKRFHFSVRTGHD